MLDVRLLGRFEIKNGKETVSLASRPAQSLFAFLILNAGTAYRREKLAGQFWPEATEDNARDYLRHAIWRIRKSLESTSAAKYLHADDLAVEFDASSDFRLDVAALRAADEADPIEQLADAVACYTGELLPGFYDEWIVLEREHLQAIFERKISGLLDLLQQRGRWSEVLGWSEKWIALGQKPEAAYRHLMSAFAAQGDMAKAVAAYDRCVKSLAELGVEPSEQTRQLHEELKTRKLTAARPAPAQPTTSQQNKPVSNVPVPLTSFVGREQELRQLAKLLASTRVLTLTGAGGVGKTRLAIQVANRVGPRFKDGVCWVELAPLADPDLVPQAIASALELQESGGQSLAERLKQYFSSRKALLILDNCEHLILACAQIVEALAEACPNIKILTTSREALDIPGESVYEVPVLSMPRAEHLAIIDRLMEYESVRLFVERARSVQPDFGLTGQNAADVYQICKRLDGIPLAVELAAARTKLLSVEHIAQRLNDRFNLLTGGSRTALPRQQTLRATIDWSYDLLAEDAQVLFRRLSVFAGGFTLEAAESICSEAPLSSQDVLGLLARLLDRSLVKVEHRGPSDRYSMLETIRQYGAQKLQTSVELAQVRTQHLDFFLQTVERAEPKLLESAEQQALFDDLEADHDNLRSAIEWAMEADTVKALRLTAALGRFYEVRGYSSEGRRAIEQALECAMQAPDNVRAKGLLHVGDLCIDQGDYPRAKGTLEESLNLWLRLGDQPRVAMSLNVLGLVAWSQGDNVTAHRMFEESLRLFRQLKDARGAAGALTNLGNVAKAEGDFSSARQYSEESVAILRQSKDRISLAAAWNNLGVVAEAQGDYASARRYYQESIYIAEELGAKDIKAYVLNGLAHVIHLQGEPGEAKQYYQESLVLFREIGDKRGIAYCLEGFAAVGTRHGDMAHSARLFAAAEALRQRIGAPLDSAERAEAEEGISAARRQLGESAFDKVWADGQAMTLEQVSALALEETRTLEERSHSPRQSRRKSHRGSHAFANDS